MEERKHKRWETFKKIIEKMREGGQFYPQDLKSELGLSDRTVDHDLKLGVYVGIFEQKEKRGPYTWIDYKSDEGSIRKTLEMLSPFFMYDLLRKERIWKNPIEFIEDAIKLAALEAGKDPSDKEFRKIYYKIAGEFFSKPTKFLSSEQRKRFLEWIEKRQEERLRKLAKNPENSQAWAK